MKNKYVILLIGGSGCGKDTCGRALEAKGWIGVKSYTTRPPRFAGENTHTFISEKEFDNLVDIVAFTTFDKYRYAATKSQVEQCDYYIIDPAGARRMMETWNNPNVTLVPVYLDASENLRRSRMLGRGDSPSAVYRRLEHDTSAFSEEQIDFIRLRIDVGPQTNIAEEVIELRRRLVDMKKGRL